MSEWLLWAAMQYHAMTAEVMPIHVCMFTLKPCKMKVCGARAHTPTHTHTVTLTVHVIESGPPEIGVEDFLHRCIVVDPLGGVCAPLAC